MADDYIKMLKERDTAKPLKKMYWAVGKEPLPACPTCGNVVILTTNDRFCRSCGQRLAKDVWEL